MARGKRERLRERRLATEIAAQLARQQKPKSRKGPLLVTAISLGLAVLGVVLGVFVLFPKVNVDALQPSGNDPFFLTTFIVMNASELSIYSIQISCDFRRIIFADGTVEHDTTAEDPTIIAEIPHQDAKAFRCPPPFIRSLSERPLKTVDLAILVSFRPSFVPWRVTHAARFVADVDANGRVRRWMRDLAANRAKGYPVEGEAPYPHPLKR